MSASRNPFDPSRHLDARRRGYRKFNAMGKELAPAHAAEYANSFAIRHT